MSKFAPKQSLEVDSRIELSNTALYLQNNSTYIDGWGDGDAYRALLFWP